MNAIQVPKKRSERTDPKIITTSDIFHFIEHNQSSNFQLDSLTH